MNVYFEELIKVEKKDELFHMTFLMSYDFGQLICSVELGYGGGHLATKPGYYPDNVQDATKWYESNIQNTECDWDIMDLVEHDISIELNFC
jgi:hypothetical protein